MTPFCRVLFALLASCFWALPAAASSCGDVGSNGNPLPKLRALAMHGQPRYGEDFRHFDYVNPDAPKGGELRLGVIGSFDSLNPFIVRGKPPYGLITGTFSLVYESLMARGWNEPFTLYGLLAESVEVSPDRSCVVFNIDPRARWQDGHKLTADDVLFSFNVLRERGRPNHRTYYRKVERAEKLGDLRVAFSFKRDGKGNIDREMPLIMGLMPVLPKHEWEGKEREFDKTTLRPPLGSGPYAVEKFEVGRSITYRRDANYWGKDLPSQRGLHNFDAIRVDFYRDDTVALQAFRAGQYDLRREPDPNKWAMSYDVPAAADGRLLLETFPHRRTEAAHGFIFNTRRPLLKDPILRAAMGLAFDGEWVNRSLFHGLYRRTESFFPNSDLAANSGREAEAAEGESFRDRLLRASAMLKNAGYKLKGEELRSPSGAKVAIEIMLSDPVEEKLALEWSRGMERLGVSARVRVVDSAQFQARMAEFDFDVTMGKWFNSLSPGNEQAFFWGSDAASQQGSRNYAGARDKNIDALIEAIPSASSREDLIAAVRRLDAALLAGNYAVLLFHIGADQIAWWRERLQHPEAIPLYGPVLETWWKRESSEDAR